MPDTRNGPSAELMDAKPRRPARGRAALAAMLAAGATFLLLPATSFRTEAVVGVGDPATPLRGAMTEAAATAALSKPVLVRAASSLVGTDVAPPAAGMLDKALVTLGLDRASGREAGLVRTLADSVSTTAGDAPGIVKIIAVGGDAGAAAQTATAVAEALIADAEVQADATRRRHEADATRQLDALRANALAVRKRFMSLGGTDVDPAQARAAAAAQTAAAQGRLDVVRAIIASGRPPVSDRHDLPQTVAALQAAYLDLSQQLAKARETYGERHTTVISLDDGMKRAAANLTAEWKRLSKVAESELAAAQDREAALRKVDAPADPAKRAALDEARRATLVAEDALARAERNRQAPATDDHPYRLVAAAPVPSEAGGVSLPWRAALAALAGLLALVAVRRMPKLRWSGPAAAVGPAVPVAAAQAHDVRDEPSFFADPVPAEDADEEAVPADAFAERPEPRRVVRREPRPLRRPRVVEARDQDLKAAMADVVAGLDAIAPQGDLPTIMVAANEAGTATTPVALALGEAAAEGGYRVLVVEAAGAHAMLAGTVEADAEPVLVEAVGALRVALRSEQYEGLVYLAPAFRDARRLAAGLARSREVPVVDEIATEFDLVVIDGGRAADSVEATLYADAFLRVAAHASRRDDERFLAAVGGTPRDFLGTVTASAFVPRPEVEPRHPLRGTRAPTRVAEAVPVRTAHRAPARPAVATRRKVAGR